MHDSSPQLWLYLVCATVVKMDGRHTLISLYGSHTLTPYIPVLLDKLGEEPTGREVARHVHLNQHLS